MSLLARFKIITKILAVIMLLSATAIAIYIAICAVITLIATALMTDYTGKDINIASAHEP